VLSYASCAAACVASPGIMRPEWAGVYTFCVPTVSLTVFSLEIIFVFL
jgi:hypothetical protein